MSTSSILFARGKELAMEAINDRDSRKKNKKPQKTVTHIKVDKDDPVDGLVRVAAGVVGMFSEASKYRKAKKDSSKNAVVEVTERRASVSSSNYDAHDLATAEEINEAIWRRDDSGGNFTNPQQPASPTEEQDLNVDGEEHQDKGWLARRRRRKLEKELAFQFIKRHPFNERTMTPGEATQIDLPVVIPQRRPEKRARGFVRAYPPVLAKSNIDEATFLDFVDSFNKSLEPNPYLYAMNLGGTVGLMLPDPFTLLVGMATMAATEATIAMNSRFNSARFLDRVNAEFFMPRGLVCLVATWKPDAPGGENPMNTLAGFDGRPVSRSDAEYLDSETNGRDTTAASPTTAKQDITAKWKEMEQYMNTDILIHKFMEQVKPAGADFEWPEPAPLVFPSAEATARTERTKADGRRKNALDRGEVWLDEYMDRRAQAKYMAANPDFTVAHALPKPEFTSRYADPFHPAASGDIVAFLTGGKYSTKGKVVPEQPAPEQQQQQRQEYDEDGYPTQSYLEDRGWQQASEQTQHRYGYGYAVNPATGESDFRDSPDYQRELTRRSTAVTSSTEDVYRPDLPPAMEETRKEEQQKKKKQKEKKNGLSRLFQQDLLYLIVVNLPSEEEMAQFAPEGLVRQQTEGEMHEADVSR